MGIDLHPEHNVPAPDVSSVNGPAVSPEPQTAGESTIPPFTGDKPPMTEDQAAMTVAPTPEINTTPPEKVTDADAQAVLAALEASATKPPEGQQQTAPPAPETAAPVQEADLTAGETAAPAAVPTTETDNARTAADPTGPLTENPAPVVNPETVTAPMTTNTAELTGAVPENHETPLPAEQTAQPQETQPADATATAQTESPLPPQTAESGAEAEIPPEKLKARISAGFMAMRRAVEDRTLTDDFLIGKARMATGETADLQMATASETSRKPIEQMATDMKSRLLEVKSEQDPKKRLELTNQILSDCHEVDWREGLAEFTAKLDAKERDYLLDITRQNAVEKFADVFNFDRATKIPEATRLATDAWNMHDALHRESTRLSFTDRLPQAPDFVVNAYTSGLSRVDKDRVFIDATAEVLKRHPKWATEVWKAFAKHILPVILSK